jgi:hypothetical protein
MMKKLSLRSAPASFLGARNMVQDFFTTERGQIMVVVHNAKPPTDDDWRTYIDGIKSLDLKTARSIVFTDGGAPDAEQRKAVNQALAGARVPGVVISPSALVRGVVTAMSWFNPGIKTFAPEQLEAAFRYLEFTPDEISRVWDKLDRLRIRLGDPTLKAIPPRPR